MDELERYVRGLEGKIERQRTELANLRKKRYRRWKNEDAGRRLERAEELEKQFETLQADVKALTEDNERLRAEVVRLSGGTKSTKRAEVEESHEEWLKRTSGILRDALKEIVERSTPAGYVPVYHIYGCGKTAFFMRDHVRSGMIKYAQDFQLLDGTIAKELYDLERCGSCGCKLECDVHPESRTVR